MRGGFVERYKGYTIWQMDSSLAIYDPCMRFRCKVDSLIVSRARAKVDELLEKSLEFASNTTALNASIETLADQE